MRFINQKGHSETLVVRTAEYESTGNGQFRLLRPAVYVKFVNSVATIEKSDPDFDVKVAACKKADFVVEMGKSPKEKLAASTDDPKIVSHRLPSGPATDSGIPATSPPKLIVRKGADSKEVTAQSKR